jgi:hypothetical protein
LGTQLLPAIGLAYPKMIMNTDKVTQRATAYSGAATPMNHTHAPARCIERQPVVRARLADELLTDQRAIAHPAISRELGPARWLTADHEVTLFA